MSTLRKHKCNHISHWEISALSPVQGMRMAIQERANGLAIPDYGKRCIVLGAGVCRL
jgi:hypothetical protein